MPYRINIPPEAKQHLASLSRRERVMLLAAAQKHLSHEPNVQTTNRKIMAPNPLGATWELRVGDLRVYYDLREDDAVVEIIAFGEKVRDRVRIGGQYVDLRAEND